MKLNDEQMKQTLSLLDNQVSPEFLLSVMEHIAEAPLAYVQGCLIWSLRRQGNHPDVGQVVKDVTARIESRKPGPPAKKGPGDSRRITREYFDSLLIEQRLMGTCIPDTGIELFGETFSTPIMTAALSHLGPSGPDRLDGMCEYALGAKISNTLHWIGMCEDSVFASYMESGAKTVRIVKPYRDNEKIFAQLKTARELGCVAVGMDIDHFLSRNGKPDVVLGEEMEVKTSDQYRQYMDFAGLPFIFKGVLSVHDALKAVELGAAGIVVSHHGGRMDFAVPPLMILEDIAKAVDGRCHIFVDCGIESGMDAYKALALGADAVSVGNHLMPFLKEEGAAGVSGEIESMTDELRGVMAYTGVSDVKSFDASVIHRR